MQQNDSFNVKYKKDSYNIFSFLNNHPGGVNYLAPYKEKDVGKRMEDTKHSRAAYYLFEEYKKEGKRKKGEEDNADLERLVDWDKPMLCQVAALGTKYKEWVISPVDRDLRLFGNPVLESMTITPWYVVPMVWIPVIIYLTNIGAERYVALTKETSPVGTIVLNIFLGVVLWSLLEYSLHRWVFHMEPSGHSKMMIYIHFAIHGLHHKVPFDTRRLVFPPLPAAIITLSLYKLFSFVIPESSIVLLVAGALLGYVMYDMIHFYLHYGAPKENTYFYHLKRYHNQHHFAHHDSGFCFENNNRFIVETSAERHPSLPEEQGFGISSVLWDKIFGTVIRLRHLNMNIRW